MVYIVLFVSFIPVCLMLLQIDPALLLVACFCIACFILFFPLYLCDFACLLSVCLLVFGPSLCGFFNDQGEEEEKRKEGQPGTGLPSR
jgi:hypothetical protein